MKKNIIWLLVVISFIAFRNDVLAYTEYKLGDEIDYKGEKYYVIENSDSDTNYITLLKSEPLTVDELYKYGRDENDHLFINEYIENSGDPEKVVFEDSAGNGNIAFYSSETCGYRYIWDVSSFKRSELISDGCTNDYNKSDVKKVVENWANSFSNDLVEVNGYKARLLTTKELMDQLGFGERYLRADSFEHSNITPSWIYAQPFSYWVISNYDYIDSSTTYIESSLSTNGEYGYNAAGGNSGAIGELREIKLYSMYAVRPVINLNKCVLNESECNTCGKGSKYITKTKSKYSSYRLGDEVVYNGQKYYVIRRSSSSTNYVTLLKKEILTKEEISKYSNGVYNGETVPFYISDSCNAEDNKSGCINSLDQSIPMQIINEWVKENVKESDLITIDEYKVRLLTTDELVDYFGYNFNSQTEYKGFKASVNLAKWIYEISYWIEGYVEDDMSLAYKTAEYIPGSYVFSESGIKPVININKCAVDGGCYNIEYETEVCDENNIDDDKSLVLSVVDVDNTGSKISIITLIICGVLIITGCILSYIHIRKLKKNNK